MLRGQRKVAADGTMLPTSKFKRPCSDGLLPTTNSRLHAATNLQLPVQVGHNQRGAEAGGLFHAFPLQQIK